MLEEKKNQEDDISNYVNTLVSRRMKNIQDSLDHFKAQEKDGLFYEKTFYLDDRYCFYFN